MDEEAKNSPVVSTRHPQRPTQTARPTADSLVRWIGSSVVCRSGPIRVADTPQVQALLEDLTDTLATISEGDKNSEEDKVVWPTRTNEPMAKRQRRMDWEGMSRSTSKGNGRQLLGMRDNFSFIIYEAYHHGALRVSCYTYAKKASWHQCPNQLHTKFLAREQMLQFWNGEDHYHQKLLVSQVAPLKDAWV